MRTIFTLLVLTLVPYTLFSQLMSIGAPDTTKTPSVELGEIVISGSKNNMKLKNLPSSVSLMTQTTIQDDNINNLADVTAIAPGVFMPDYGSKLTSPIYIRGIGSRINAPGVGLYVDGVPYFEKSAFNFNFFDIERIEILRGPQGTLYGRNTIGGVINIKTLSPFDFQGAKAKIGLGSYGQYEANAGYYHQFNEKFGVSLSAIYNKGDGFYTNEYTDKQVDESETLGFRNKIIWKPTEKLTISSIASFEHSDEGGYPYAVYDSVEGEAMPINYNEYSSFLRNMFSEALIFKYEADNLDIKLTSSYQMLDGQQEIDQDFTPDSVYFVVQEELQHMQSNELIIRSKDNATYNWLFGAFQFSQQFDKTVDVTIHTPGMTVLKEYDHQIMGGALFHQSELTLGNLTLTGGLRVDLEKDKQDYTYDRIMAGTTTPVDDTTASREYFEILPKIAANYRFNGTNIYATIARGYKTGGFNSSFDEDHPEHMEFESEYSMNYEVGVKTSLINKQLYADFALYYIDWDNQQIYESNPSGRGSHLTNAGQSISQGVELTLKTVPFCGYVTTVTYAYNHATFESYEVNDSVNYNGNFIPYAPRHTISARFSKSYELRHSNILDKIRISLLYTGVGKIYWDETNRTSQKFYNLFSTKVSFIKDKFGLNFWRKNLLETEYHSFAFDALGNQYVQPGKPSRYGFSLTYNF
ncbi:hypothetical protein L21SP5_03566 [Salinivirga cyanobacteriivorans]|uniref:TonB-dependent receptor plug domain-containing protein n=1 Tax=Salinivirga cyanobacteriivorans TaxID=1307839 RepID=A0A0S2I498_9BACT|nr:TonB-dependent receptor plug domain-containing protein [Salinivirga cyanobacteriivorans]ALO17174.1 hypothetical protein L21SP5_03566 [Salinivirga cyanobacteriivorans]